METVVDTVTVITVVLDVEEAKALETWLGTRVELPAIPEELYVALITALDEVNE